MAKKTNNEMTGWVGWIGFASLMLYLVGIFHIIAGFAALFNDKVYAVGPNAFWILDLTQWGWIHTLGGVLAILAASSLLKGGVYGRTVADLVALFSAIVNMAFVPVYPIWSIIMVTISVLVVWAVVVHGSEVKEAK